MTYFIYHSKQKDVTIITTSTPDKVLGNALTDAGFFVIAKVHGHNMRAETAWVATTQQGKLVLKPYAEPY